MQYVTRADRLKRTAAVLLAVILASAFLMPAGAFAKEKEKNKTVRVGWYESSFCAKDASGRRTGYAYEYQVNYSPPGLRP